MERGRENHKRKNHTFDGENALIHPPFLEIQDFWSLGYPYNVQHTLTCIDHTAREDRLNCIHI